MASNGVSREASRSAPSSRPVLAAVAQQNARNHPLFGVLDFIAAKTQSNTSAIAAVDVRLEKLEDSVSRIAELQKELKQLVEQQKESNFSIEKTKYKVPLRTGAANLFCGDLLRHPSEEKITRMVKGVIGGNKERFFIEASVKYVTSLMVTFRCEERRKVLTPTGKYTNKATKPLAYLLMDYMKADRESCTINYVRHLAILRKYVRDTSDVRDKKNFYNSFKLWIEQNYAEITEENWKSVLEEDESICYSHNSDSLPSASGSGSSGWESEVDSSPYNYNNM